MSTRFTFAVRASLIGVLLFLTAALIVLSFWSPCPCCGF